MHHFGYSKRGKNILVRSFFTQTWLVAIVTNTLTCFHRTITSDVTKFIATVTWKSRRKRYWSPLIVCFFMIAIYQRVLDLFKVDGGAPKLAPRDSLKINTLQWAVFFLRTRSCLTALNNTRISRLIDFFQIKVSSYRMRLSHYCQDIRVQNAQARKKNKPILEIWFIKTFSFSKYL